MSLSAPHYNTTVTMVKIHTTTIIPLFSLIDKYFNDILSAEEIWSPDCTFNAGPPHLTNLHKILCPCPRLHMH